MSQPNNGMFWMPWNNMKAIIYMIDFTTYVKILDRWIIQKKYRDMFEEVFRPLMKGADDELVRVWEKLIASDH